MAPLMLLLALPATLLATVEAAGFFRGLRPLPMPFPLMPYVHPMPLIHPIPLPLMPPPHVMPHVRRPSRTRSTGTTTTTEVRSVPVNTPISSHAGDVIVVINDSDCFSGLCRRGGFGGGIGSAAGFVDGLDMMDRRSDPGFGLSGRRNYNIHDADHVIIGGNGRY